MNLLAGTTLQDGKYRIVKCLGRGGFGITYLAEQLGLNRKVAIKEFFMENYCEREEHSSRMTVPTKNNRDFVTRFLVKFIKEAQNIAALNHPNIIRIYDIFEENETAYYVMEYHPNGSLAHHVSAQIHLNEEEALRYIRQMADALDYIHLQQICHLDVKPENVLLDIRYNAVLIDFGLSKHYNHEGQQTSSTPLGISDGFAPLEQYQYGGVAIFSPTTDIYSLGATLYTLLTGKIPPLASEVYEEGLPILPEYISKSTVLAIEKAMQTKRKERPQSIPEFLEYMEKKNVEKYGEKTKIREDLLNEVDWVEEKLRTVGKKSFVNLYPELKKNISVTLEEISNKYPAFLENNNLNSQNTKLSTARTIFKKGKSEIALKNIVNSKKVDKEIREKARALLQSNK